MLVVKNKAKFTFVWPERSPYVEVYRDGDPDGIPFEALDAADLPYSKEALNKIANESAEFAKPL